MANERQLSLMAGLLLAVTIAACSTSPPATPPADDAAFERLDASLRSVRIAFGASTVEVLVADHLIAGFDLADFPGVDAELRAKFEQSLAGLGLVRWSVRTPPPYAPWVDPHATHLTLFDSVDSKQLPSMKRQALATLRQSFGPSFGPAVFDQTKQILFSLQNRIIVGFGNETDAKTAEAMLRKSGAVTVLRTFGLGQNRLGYRVTYPTDWGLAIFEVGNRLAVHEAVEHIEYELYTVEQFTELHEPNQ